MKSMAHCSAILAGLLALTGLVPTVWARTIVVNSYGAAVFVSPGWHLADLALPVSHTDARFRPVSAAIGATMAARLRDHGPDSTPLQASFGSPAALTGLYREARRFALNSARSVSAVGDGTSVAAPVRSDFPAMLLVGAVLVAHQLRRKHRSLKQSLIAG